MRHDYVKDTAGRLLPVITRKAFLDEWKHEADTTARLPSCRGAWFFRDPADGLPSWIAKDKARPCYADGTLKGFTLPTAPAEPAPC